MRMRALGVVAMAAALVVGLASPAAAQTKTLKDKSGDVKVTTYDKDGNPHMANDSSGLSDISEFTASYTNKALVFTAKFAKKSKKNVNQVDISVDTLGKNAGSYSIFWSADKSMKAWNGLHVNGDDWETVIAPVTVERTAGQVTVTVDSSTITSAKKVSYAFTAGFASQGAKRFTRTDWYPNAKFGADGQSWETLYKKIKKG